MLLLVQVARRDLGAIRRWYASQDGDMFNEKVTRRITAPHGTARHRAPPHGSTTRTPHPPPRLHAPALLRQVMRLAKLRYVICSHSPFFNALQLRASLSPPPPPPRYRTALEVDGLTEGEWGRVAATLASAGEACTLRGVDMLLGRCAAALCRLEYVSASTAHTFEYSPRTCSAGDQNAGSAHASPRRERPARTCACR